MATVVEPRSVVGDAPQWAMDRARKIVQPSETILAVYTVSPQNLKAVPKQAFALFMFPCFWPQAILCSPCMISRYYSTKAALESTVYVITERRLYISVDSGAAASSSPFACAQTTGLDSGDVPLGDINGLTSDLPGRFFGEQICPTTKVIVGLPLGHPLARHGGNGGKNALPDSQAYMYVDNPSEVIQLLRAAKDNSANIGGVGGAPPIAAQVAQPAMPVAQPVGTLTTRGTGDPYERLKKLKNLLDTGVITQKEFDEKKERLMNQL